MGMLNDAIVLTLIALAFLAGKTMSDRYNAGIIEELRYLLRLNAARDGVGYVAPPISRSASRYRYRNVVGQDFMDRLHENGRAVQRIPR